MCVQFGLTKSDERKVKLKKVNNYASASECFNEKVNNGPGNDDKS